MPNLKTIPDVQAWDVGAHGQARLASWMTPPCVANIDAMTAQEFPQDIYKVLAGTDTQHAKVNLVPIPAGATYGRIAMEYVGTAPTVYPQAFCWGRVRKSPSFPVTLFPETVHASYHNISTGEDWVLLGNESTGQFLFDLNLDAATDLQDLNGASHLTTPRIIHVCGCDLFACTINRACVTPTRSLVVARFAG